MRKTFWATNGFKHSFLGALIYPVTGRGGVGQQNHFEKQGMDRVVGDMGKKDLKFILLQLLVFIALQAGVPSAASWTTNQLSCLSHQQLSLVMLKIRKGRPVSFFKQPRGFLTLQRRWEQRSCSEAMLSFVSLVIVQGVPFCCYPILTLSEFISQKSGTVIYTASLRTSMAAELCCMTHESF